MIFSYVLTMATAIILPPEDCATGIIAAITGDAFELSLLTRGFDVRHFASISIYDALLGIVTPLLAVALGRKLGRRAAMILLLVLAAALSCVFFCSPGIVVVVALLLLFNALDDLWDPIADAHLQSLIPSRVRATVGSVANQVGELAGIVGLAFFGLLLGVLSSRLFSQEIGGQCLLVRGQAHVGRGITRGWTPPPPESAQHEQSEGHDDAGGDQGGKHTHPRFVLLG